MRRPSPCEEELLKEKEENEEKDKRARDKDLADKGIEALTAAAEERERQGALH